MPNFMNQKLIERLRKGEIAVHNNGSLQDLQNVLNTAFPDDYTPEGTFKYYLSSGGKYWLAYDVITRTSYGVRDFLVDDFVLPEKWCIQSDIYTDEKIRNFIDHNVSDFKPELGWWYYSDLKMACNTIDTNHSKYTEITYEQFEKHVMKKQTETFPVNNFAVIIEDNASEIVNFLVSKGFERNYNAGNGSNNYFYYIETDKKIKFSLSLNPTYKIYTLTQLKEMKTTQEEKGLPQNFTIIIQNNAKEILKFFVDNGFDLNDYSGNINDGYYVIGGKKINYYTSNNEGKPVLTLKELIETQEKEPIELPKQFVIQRDESNYLWNKYIFWLNEQTGFSFDGSDNYYGYGYPTRVSSHYARIEHFDENPTILTLQEWDEIVNDKKEPIGYICPMDLFKGRIKKGSLFTEYSENKLVMYNKYHMTSGVATEIVHTWEPVYEETFVVGDWVTFVVDRCVGDLKHYKTGFWNKKMTFQISEIHKNVFNFSNTYYYSEDGLGAGNDKRLFRKATQSEIDEATKLPVIGDYEGKYDKETQIVSYGCQSFSSELVNTLCDIGRLDDITVHSHKITKRDLLMIKNHIDNQ